MINSYYTTSVAKMSCITILHGIINIGTCFIRSQTTNKINKHFELIFFYSYHNIKMDLCQRFHARQNDKNQPKVLCHEQQLF